MGLLHFLESLGPISRPGEGGPSSERERPTVNHLSSYTGQLHIPIALDHQEETWAVIPLCYMLYC